MARLTARLSSSAMASAVPTRTPACSAVRAIAELGSRLDPARGLRGSSHGGDELLHRFFLELADALASQAEVLSHLAQRHRYVRVEPEPHANHGGFALTEPVEAVEDPLQVVQLDQEIVGGLRALVGQPIEHQ